MFVSKKALVLYHSELFRLGHLGDVLSRLAASNRNVLVLLQQNGYKEGH